VLGNVSIEKTAKLWDSERAVDDVGDDVMICDMQRENRAL
jgi:hypothetical protein